MQTAGFAVCGFCVAGLYCVRVKFGFADQGAFGGGQWSNHNVVFALRGSGLHIRGSSTTAKVRFFGDDLAVVYGSESSVPKAKDGTGKSRCLICGDSGEAERSFRREAERHSG